MGNQGRSVQDKGGKMKAFSRKVGVKDLYEAVLLAIK